MESIGTTPVVTLAFWVNAVAAGPVFVGGAAPDRIEALAPPPSSARPLSPPRSPSSSRSWRRRRPAMSPGQSSQSTAAVPPS